MVPTLWERNNFNRGTVCWSIRKYAKLIKTNVFQVYVGDHQCGVITYKAGQDVYTITCENTVGNVIKVVQNNNYLTLCEVKAFGHPGAAAVVLPVVEPKPGKLNQFRIQHRYFNETG